MIQSGFLDWIVKSILRAIGALGGSIIFLKFILGKIGNTVKEIADCPSIHYTTVSRMEAKEALRKKRYFKSRSWGR